MPDGIDENFTIRLLAPLREAILYALDVLVESGSSAAFRMRDDFVTPAA